MLKRITAALAAFAMIFMQSAAFADRDEAGVSELLAFLNIDAAENGGELSRAEAAKLLCLAGGIGENYGENVLTDISSVPEAGYIVSAYNLGYISVGREYVFEPNEKISCKEFARSFVKLLGYRKAAERDGYDKYISSLKLLSGVKDAAAALDRTSAAVIIGNALEAPKIVQTVFGSKPEYTSDESKTLLTEVFRLRAEEGYITAVDKTALYDSNGAGTGKIKLGNNVYTYENGNRNLLGKYVKAYIDSEDNIKAVLVKQAKCREYVCSIDKESLAEINGNTFSFCEEGRRSKYEIATAASFIYNGVFDLDFTPDMLENVRLGEITLLDNDNDGTIEVVFVNEYVNYLVRGAADGKIFDRHGQPPIDLEDNRTKYVSVTKNGENITLSEIKSWNTASVYMSRDKKSISIEVSDKSVFEEITVQYEEGGFTVLGLSGKEFESGITGFPDYTPERGNWGKFYFDSHGRISGADLKSDIKTYGYLTGCDKKGIKSDVRLKLLNAIGKYKVFQCKSKVEFNGKKVSAADVYDEFKKTGAQLVSYKVNGENEITLIDTVGGNIVQDVADDKGLWRSGSYSFASKYNVGTDTVIFNIPSDMTSFDDDDLSVISPSALISTKEYSNINVYDTDELHTAGAIVLRGAVSTTDDNNVYFIKSVKYSSDSSGNDISVLEYNDRGQISRLFADTGKCGQVTAGTGIRITGTNARGNIISFSEEFNGSEEDYLDKYIAGDKNHGVGASCVTAMGVISAVGDSSFSVSGSPYIYLASASVSCSEYKESKFYFEPIAFMELQPGDRVFIVKSGDVVVSVVRLGGK